MLFQCLGKEDVSHIIEYIGDNFVAAPYLYVNLKRYGVSNPNIFIWTDIQKNKLCGVYLLYYDTLHFYTKETQYSVNAFLNWFHELNPKVVFTSSEFGSRLAAEISGKYIAKEYYIADLNVSRPLPRVNGVEIADRNDLADIADLMLTDPEFKDVYDRTILESQLLSRFDDSFSRYFIIRCDGKVVAAYSTYGECDKMYILSGLVVHPDYRRRGLGSQIMKFAHKAVAADGVMGVTLLRSDNAATIEIHKKNGAVFAASQYKFIRV